MILFLQKITSLQHILIVEMTINKVALRTTSSLSYERSYIKKIIDLISYTLIQRIRLRFILLNFIKYIPMFNKMQLYDIILDVFNCIPIPTYQESI